MSDRDKETEPPLLGTAFSHPVFPLFDQWKHAGVFKAVVVAVTMVGAVLLAELVDPAWWQLGLVAAVVAFGAIAVAEFALRRRARRNREEECP